MNDGGVGAAHVPIMAEREPSQRISAQVRRQCPAVQAARRHEGSIEVHDKPVGAGRRPWLQDAKLLHCPALQRLKEAAMKHEEFMAEIDLKNVQGARDMQMKAMDSDDPLVRRYVYYFITFWSILSSIYIGFITFGDIPEANVRFADTILGFVLGTMVASMFQFLLGSSLGSRKKDEKK